VLDHLNCLLTLIRFVYSKPNDIELTFIIVENKIADYFHVSERLLKRYAPNLYAFLTHDEHKKKQMYASKLQIPDISHETFKDFSKWLAHQLYWDEDAELAEGEKDDNYDDEYADMGPLYYDSDPFTIRAPNLYFFACQYDMPQLRKDALDRFLGGVKWDEVLVDAAAFVYPHTQPGSPLRRILVDHFCNERRAENEGREYLDKYPKEFLVDALVRNAEFMMETGTCDQFIDMNVHAYHECDGVVVGGKRKAGTGRVVEQGGW